MGVKGAPPALVRLETSPLTNKLGKKLTKHEMTLLYQLIAGRVGVAAEFRAREYPLQSNKPLPYFYTRDEVAGKKVRPFLSKFKSSKQAWFVLQLGKSGKIPFKRSGTLGKTMSHRVYRRANIWIVEVGTNAPYGKLVMGDEGEQSHYHKPTWRPLSQKVGDNDAKQEYQKVISDTLKGAMRLWFKK